MNYATLDTFACASEISEMVRNLKVQIEEFLLYTISLNAVVNRGYISNIPLHEYISNIRFMYKQIVVKHNALTTATNILFYQQTNYPHVRQAFARPLQMTNSFKIQESNNF